VIPIKRPLVTILIGAIIGIIYGLYLQISVAINIILVIFLLLIFQKNKKRTFYFLMKRRKLILIILISIIFFSLYTILVKNKYEKTYKEIQKNKQTVATVVSEAKETTYYNSYEIKIKNRKFILYVKKNSSEKLKYGTQIALEAQYTEPEESRNYKGFNYKEYLKTKKIYGSFKADKITILQENNLNSFLMFSNNFRNKVIEIAKEILPEETEGLMIGLLIGENKYIKEEVSENFSKSGLSHIVAISGSHISYIIIGLSFILTKSKIHKKGTYIIIILGLIFFMFITGFSPSIVRACIMGIILIFSKIVYCKSDILNSIALSLIIILINNPYSIKDVGLQLSYLGTLGIVYLNTLIQKFLEKYINKKIAEIISVTLSAQIAVLPILVINFNTFPTLFLLSNILVIPISGAITLYGYGNVLVGIISLQLAKVLGIILNFMAKILMCIAEITAKLPFSTITIITPSVVTIVFYYLFVLFYKKKFMKKIFICFLIFLSINFISNIIPQNLKIYFIDVGQRR